jgi:hypothetical protein
MYDLGMTGCVGIEFAVIFIVKQWRIARNR